MSQQGEHSAAARLAHGLGWVSVSIGVAELAAPGVLARCLGLPDDQRTRGALRALGARELAHGLVILAGPHAPGVWSRVGGDAIDLALLGSVLSSQRADRSRVIAAASAVAGLLAIDAVCATRLQRESDRGRAARRQPVRVEHVVTINRPIGDVYRQWIDLEAFPGIMRHVDSVEVLGEGRSRWRVKAPAGTHVTWEAEEVGRREHEWIGWRTLSGSDVEHTGSVTFSHAPGARGTELRVVLEYKPPVGKAGRAIARLLGEEPAGQLREGLRQFKQFVETGEVAVSDAPGLWRPARPAAHGRRTPVARRQA